MNSHLLLTEEHFTNTSVYNLYRVTGQTLWNYTLLSKIFIPKFLIRKKETKVRNLPQFQGLSTLPQSLLA